MKRKDSATKNQKYLAIFLAATMLLSIFVVLIQGSTNNSNDDVPTPEVGNDSLIFFSQVPGKQVNHQFNSIADGLKMSPEGPISALYVDMQKTAGTPLETALGTQEMMTSFYGVEVTKRYSTIYADGNGFELHQIPEQKMIIPMDSLVSPYKGYQFLDRTNGTYDIWNVVGSPAVLGSHKNVELVIDVLEGNATATTEFDQLLSQADPEGNVYQEVAKRTNNSIDMSAEQYYRDLKKLDDGSYMQTSIYLNPKPEVNEKITAFQANSSERGVTYNVTTLDNITKLVISSDFESLYNESALLSI
ncbi:hypothetical protein EO98_10320 [Methanosarcina sp. 2.H.T.1A.6]|uniref:hypothetical protein n=1 Tax=unclassified Methanosarcina TaxID=2644672 RepID=UPI0006215C78|nr:MULTISPECIES: hypothetical protein [unclassified Methanosarcina]KKG14339.1 hypothetical protein EO94_16700 [Methanosarcina sp. 2.H.T.1A.3]KKG19829.1 hypothetical protein EO98_10320 [Methanosarcina sp. 2.H.T.1A.6]KKG20257.1 hypothetical protein EO97_06700 [Methanosarcina sp. 2.H.T.1A.15]KKG27212.1 hypothetical protein EO96_09705 [Methanosarcina sp. 2.H.T.1A.8]